MPQITRTVRIGSSRGLHARPAKLLATAAKSAGIPITIGKVGENAVNAASLLSVMAIGAKFGEDVEISVADGDGADLVLASLVEIVATNHDE